MVKMKRMRSVERVRGGGCQRRRERRQKSKGNEGEREAVRRD